MRITEKIKEFMEDVTENRQAKRCKKKWTEEKGKKHRKRRWKRKKKKTEHENPLITIGQMTAFSHSCFTLFFSKPLSKFSNYHEIKQNFCLAENWTQSVSRFEISRFEKKRLNVLKLHQKITIEFSEKYCLII